MKLYALSFEKEGNRPSLPYHSIIENITYLLNANSTYLLIKLMTTSWVFFTRSIRGVSLLLRANYLRCLTSPQLGPQLMWRFALPFLRTSSLPWPKAILDLSSQLSKQCAGHAANRGDPLCSRSLTMERLGRRKYTSHVPYGEELTVSMA